jgi:hypothetical protein
MIAQGVRDNGLGEGGNMLFGMNLASALNPQNASATSSNTAQDEGATSKIASIDAQVENLKKLKVFLDAGRLQKAREQVLCQTLLLWHDLSSSSSSMCLGLLRFALLAIVEQLSVQKGEL